MQSLLTSPGISVTPINKCWPALITRTYNFSWFKMYCKAAVSFSHSHSLMSLIVILCVAPSLIQQMLSYTFYIVHFGCFVISSGPFSGKLLWLSFVWKALPLSLCTLHSLHEQLHHSCHSEWQRCLADTPRPAAHRVSSNN